MKSRASRRLIARPDGEPGRRACRASDPLISRRSADSLKVLISLWDAHPLALDRVLVSDNVPDDLEYLVEVGPVQTRSGHPPTGARSCRGQARPDGALGRARLTYLPAPSSRLAASFRLLCRVRSCLTGHQHDADDRTSSRCPTRRQHSGSPHIRVPASFRLPSVVNRSV